MKKKKKKKKNWRSVFVCVYVVNTTAQIHIHGFWEYLRSTVPGGTRQARDHGPTCIPHAQPCGRHTPNTWPLGHVRRDPTKPRSHPTSAHFRTTGWPVNSKGNWLINNMDIYIYIYINCVFLKMEFSFPCPPRPAPYPLSPKTKKKRNTRYPSLLVSFVSNLLTFLCKLCVVRVCVRVQEFGP